MHNNSHFCITLAVLFCIGFSAGAQEQDRIPVSWAYNLEAPQSVDLSLLDLSQVVMEDQINDADKNTPWRYGIERPLVLHSFDHGTWSNLPDGQSIWRMAITSPGALNISINFSEFYLPEGGQLQIYNNSRSDWSKVYTHHGGTAQKTGTWFVQGDEVILEYVQAPNAYELPRIATQSIIHGYRMGALHQLLDSEQQSRAPEDSGDCNYDVNCPVGGDFDGYKEKLKKAVALLNLGNGYLCSSVLLNNTKQDKTPYVLTANHCLQNSDPDLWSLRFNWISPNPVCGEAEPSADINTNFTMNGAELRGFHERSDFALVELREAIPDSWDVVFAGWDRSDELPEFQAGIHHPRGDLMKISMDLDPAAHEFANGTDVWLIKGQAVGNGNGWDLGTTEGGSSGSPLFNQNGLVIGQLYGGMSACDGTQTNGGYDLYGRFASAWDYGATQDMRLSNWLDPEQTGYTQIGTLENSLNIGDFELDGQIAMYPNPAQDYVTIRNTQYPSLRGVLYNIVGQKLLELNLSATENHVMLDQYANGIYLLHLVDQTTGNTMAKKLHIQR
jgi:lysyl endopeptidase